MSLILTQKDFDEKVLQSKEVVLVDFFAPWCGPCRMIAPIIEEIAHEIGEGRVYSIDIDQTPEIAEKYSVMSIPTIKIFKNGTVVDETVGGQEKSVFLKMLEKQK